MVIIARGVPAFSGVLGSEALQVEIEFDTLKLCLVPLHTESFAPPPTIWQSVTDVHWEKEFFSEVATRVDQMAPMMYDTSILLEKAYIKLMHDWTKEVIEWSGDTEVLLGIPAYEDEGVNYHHPRVENISSALRGIHSALKSYDHIPSNYSGIAIYSEWTMTDEKWQQIEKAFSK